MLTRQRGVRIALLVVAGLSSNGCRTNPAGSVFALVGQAVDASELQELEPLLVGKEPDVADATFGRRFDTLEDVKDGASWLVYIDPDSGSAVSRTVVEVRDGKIAALHKTMQNASGAADAVWTDILKARLARKTPRESEEELGLGNPVLHVKSRRTNHFQRVYDARRIPQLEAARYCILEFNARELCVDVRVVGVTASTGRPPARSP